MWPQKSRKGSNIITQENENPDTVSDNNKNPERIYKKPKHIFNKEMSREGKKPKRNSP